MVVALLRRPPAAGLAEASPGEPFVPSATVLLPDDPRAEISDYAGVAERSPRRLRFVRPGNENYRYAGVGARYRFRTDATSVTFTVAWSNLLIRNVGTWLEAVLLVNGTAVASFSGEAGTYVFGPYSAAMRTYELVFPYADGMDLLRVEVSEGASFEAPPPRPAAKLACCGDSITQGFYATRTPQSYAYRLAELLNRQMLNFGDGSDIAVAAYGSLLAGCGADIVTYFIGYNDFGQQRALSAYQASIEGWIVNALAALPAAQFFVGGPFYTPHTNTRTPADYRASAAAAVSAVGSPRVTYVNALALMTNSSTRLVDGVHPNDTGHGEIGPSLATIISG